VTEKRLNPFYHIFKDDDAKWIKFPNAEYMKGFKKKKRDPGDFPPPEECIREMVNYQLKVRVTLLFKGHNSSFTLKA